MNKINNILFYIIVFKYIFFILKKAIILKMKKNESKYY